MTRLDRDELLDAARRAAGRPDFDFGAILPRLDRFLEALSCEALLSKAGSAGRAFHTVRLLTNIIRLAEASRRRPELAAPKIGVPIVVTGIPRSGTTKLHRLLAASGGKNSMAFWEALYPIALSDNPGDRAERRRVGGSLVEQMRLASPAFFAAHPVGGDEAEEEMVVMQHSFLTESVDAEVRVPGFVASLAGEDRRPMYAQLRQWLRLLGEEHGAPESPWILKGTYHTAHLDALLSELPEARIVHIHRDPVETLASYCSLVSMIRGLSSDDVDRADLGRELLGYWSAHLAQAMRVRDRLPGDAVLDVDYADVVADGIGVAERVLAFGGTPADAAARRAMQSWERDNAQHRHGRHEYRLEDYGLTGDEVADACAGYRERYGMAERMVVAP